MSVGWVAASTRGRALLQRLVGIDRARTLVELEWPQARQALSSTVYGKDLSPDAGRDDARNAAMTATAWHLRVLAGWLPPGQSGLARLFAAPLEMANIEDHLAVLEGSRRSESPIRLGSLATAWPRVARATSPESVRAVVTASVWGDPGGPDRTSVALGLRCAWARRLADQSPNLERWAKGGAAVLVARERFAFERAVNKPTGRLADDLIGKRWRDAGSVAEMAQSLSDVASWALEGVDEPTALWRAEANVARRVASEAQVMAASTNANRATVIGIMALMLLDLRHVLAVIELAGRGPNLLEVLDAVA